MYIDPFLAGVLTTILVLAVSVIVFSIGFKGKKNNDEGENN